MPNSITITKPSTYTVCNAGSGASADIAIVGAVTFGSTCHVEANLSTQGAGYTRIATVSAGTAVAYSGTLLAQNKGARGVLTVRLEEDTAISASVICGVGITFVVIGDSRILAQGATVSYTQTTLGVSCTANSVQDNSWQDANGANGWHTEVMPYCDLLALQNNCCIGYLWHGHSGTDLGALPGAWAISPDGADTDDFQNKLVNARMTFNHVWVVFGPNAIGGYYGGTGPGDYQSKVSAMVAFLASEVPGAQTFWSLVGESGTAGSTPHDIVRAAVLSVVASSTDASMGDNLLDQTYTDHTHPSTNPQVVTMAQRAFLATKGYIAGTADVRGPRISSIRHSGSTVTLTFNQALGNSISASLSTSAFKVTLDGTPATVSAATVTTSTQVALTLSSPIGSAVVAVTLGSGEVPSAGWTLPKSTTYTLPDATTQFIPAEPFYATASPSGGGSPAVFASVVH